MSTPDRPDLDPARDSGYADPGSTTRTEARAGREGSYRREPEAGGPAPQDAGYRERDTGYREEPGLRDDTGRDAGHPDADHEAGRAAGAPATDPGRSGDAGHRAGAAGQTANGQEGMERLFPQDRAEAYVARWDSVKGSFVDEPRRAVAQADALVGELLDELDQLFREQRRSLEQGLDADASTTEDLRQALRRYRSFFDRLLTL
jgi:hypothetical protein